MLSMPRGWTASSIRSASKPESIPCSSGVENAHDSVGHGAPSGAGIVADVVGGLVRLVAAGMVEPADCSAAPPQEEANKTRHANSHPAALPRVMNHPFAPSTVPPIDAGEQCRLA